MFKTAAFGLSAAYAGVAGALLAIHLGSVNAIAFLPTLSITLLVGTALGGFGALFGTIFGALFIQYAPLKAEDWGLDIDLATPLPPSVTYGVFLLLVLFLMPGGLAQLVLRIPWSVHHNKTALHSSHGRGGNDTKERYMRKAALVLAAVAGSLVFGLTGAFGGAEATPGVSAKVVKIGATFPFSGTAAQYAPIGRGMIAYFSYENSTKRGADNARGCGGRQVQFITYDDALQPHSDRHADDQARRAGQGIRNGRGTGHRAAAGGSELPQQEQGAAALRVHRRDVLGCTAEGVQVVARLAARLPG